MADIELVIKIPEKVINRILEYKEMPYTDLVIEAIYHGVQLPKGHGRLGDLDKIKKEMQDYYDDCAKTSEYTRLGFETAIAVVKDASTIIEADKSVIEDAIIEEAEEYEADLDN